jgi:hypothetical protein
MNERVKREMGPGKNSDKIVQRKNELMIDKDKKVRETRARQQKAEKLYQ